MKRLIRFWLILTLVSGTFVSSVATAVADPPAKVLAPGILVPRDEMTYSVTLTSTPASQSSITLTARVMQRPRLSTINAASPLVDHRLRYTFKAQRTWPCADTTVSIADNTNQSSQPWSGVGAKAGEYTVFTVHITAVQNLLDVRMPRLPDVIGDATLSTAPFTVKPAGTVATVWEVSPAAGTTGPVSAVITSKVNFPPEFTQYRFKITCFPYCQPASGTSALGSQAYYPLQTTITPPAGGPSGGTQLNTWVDQVHTPDCVWVGSTQAYKFDYWVKAP